MRFYEKAAALYQKAIEKKETYDAVYNLARVQFRLATEFLLPPSILDVYASAIGLFKQAMELTDNPLLKADAAFNLAQVLSSWADFMEEYVGDVGENAKELRDGAVTLLTPVLNTQVTWVEGQKIEDAEKAKAEANMTEEQKKAEAEKKKNEMEVDGDEEAYEEHNPTPDSVVDTLLMIAEIGTRLWETAEPLQPPTDKNQEAVRGFVETARQYASPERQPEVDLADFKVLLAYDGVMWELLKNQAKPESGIERGMDAAITALTKLLNSLDAQPGHDSTTRADILTTLAETEMSAGERAIFFLKKFPDQSAALAAKAWSYFAAATQHLTAATGLPPTNQTPKEYRPNLYIELAKGSLNRARLAPSYDAAKNNAQQLLNNCSAYCAKAADTLGWNFPKLPTKDTETTATKLDPPHASGWDMELLARTLVFLMLRICFFVRAGKIIPDDAVKQKYEAAAKAIVASITSVPSGPRRIMPKDLQRFVEDVEEAEGGIETDEDEWWREVGQGIRQGLSEEEAPCTRPALAQSLFDGVGEEQPAMQQ